MNKVLELYGFSTRTAGEISWEEILSNQHCPYLERTCIKVRKSEPDKTIGTCSVEYGRDQKRIIICPHRLLERRQIFTDCIHLLTLHEPGNEFHVVSEISVPGGSVDYFLVSANNGKAQDFVGIELQTLDTTGTVWPERQRLVREKGAEYSYEAAESGKTFGMNWKMTAKTILVQLHHKIETFEQLGKHLVLVIQDHLLDYMSNAFRFEHLKDARLGDSMHFHTYAFSQTPDRSFRLALGSRFSTDANGIAESLGLQGDANVQLEEILATLDEKLSDETLFTFP